MIDTHVHFWDYQLGIYSWIERAQREDLKRSFLLADYLRYFKKPEALITIEAANALSTLQEVEWIKQYIVDPAKNIKIKHLAYIDILSEPLQFLKQLALFAAYPFVCGFRCILLDAADFSNLETNLAALKAHDYIFNCQAHPQQLQNLFGIIQNSGVCCLIDHAGLPQTLKPQTQWFDMLNTFAHTSIYFKLTQTQPEVIEHLLKFISTKQILLGSNFPVAKQDWDAFPKELQTSSDTNARQLFKL